MRFTPQMRDLNWLVARPIAHRGFHDEAKGLVENCEAAFANAIKHGFSIETDLQITADGEAVVFHDDTVERVLDGKGSVKSLTVKQLKAMNYRGGKDRIQTLAELLEQVAGRTTLLIELKTHWDGDEALTRRALDVLQNYTGPYAIMSFDPDMIACAAVISPYTVRGITADRVTDAYYNPLSVARRLDMQLFNHLPRTKPHFVSFDSGGFPYAPVDQIRSQGHPILTWTIESKQQAAHALRYSDQITFQNYHPE